MIKKLPAVDYVDGRLVFRENKEMNENLIAFNNLLKPSMQFVSNSGEVLLSITSEGVVFNKNLPADDLAKEVISIIEKNCFNQKAEGYVSKMALRSWCEERIAFMNMHKDNYGASSYFPYKMILEKFCTGEV